MLCCASVDNEVTKEMKEQVEQSYRIMVDDEGNEFILLDCTLLMMLNAGCGGDDAL